MFLYQGSLKEEKVMLNYDQMYEELNKTQELLTSEIMKLNQKDDLTPGELSSLKDAVCVMKDILKLDMMIEDVWDDGEDDGYSEYSMRRGSYARGRSPRTGRYVSRENVSHRTPMRGVSGHSLHDRMAANLETMMDDATSDYERQQIGKWIDKIKSAPEN
jgi:hypothetical protein